MPRQQKMDAVALLKADHRKVEGLFEKFEKARDKERKQADDDPFCPALETRHSTEGSGRVRSVVRTYDAPEASSVQVHP